MGTIDEYLDGLDGVDRAVIAHAYEVAAETAGETVQGTSYGMPALMYRGKALFAVKRAKKHIAVYPFSGSVPAAVADAIEGVEHDKGTIRFQPDAPLPDDALRALVRARIAEIDGAR